MRNSDATVSISGRRFEIPTRYRTLRRVHLRYARWDLTSADLVDPHTDTILCSIYPLDKARNADRARSAMPAVPQAREATLTAEPSTGIAPLLRELLAEHAATGRPPAYVPIRSAHEETSTDE